MTPHERLERSMWDLFYLPAWVKVIDRPELLALRSPRGERYFNCVYRARGAASAIDGLIREVMAFHPWSSRWQVADTVPVHDLERGLAAHGYGLDKEHDARVAAVADFVGRGSSGFTVRRVLNEETLRDAWRVGALAFGGAIHEGDDEHDAERVADELSKCGGAQARVLRYVAYLDDEPVAAGNMNLYPPVDLAVMWGGGTVPSFRGRGAYSALVAARVAALTAVGIRHIGLYARRDTSSPIVAKQGFAVVGQMRHWSR